MQVNIYTKKCVRAASHKSSNKKRLWIMEMNVAFKLKIFFGAAMSDMSLFILLPAKKPKKHPFPRFWILPVDLYDWMR